MLEVKPCFEIIEESDPIKKIEKIARVCYKSEDLICDGSDVKMIRGLIDRSHTAMLEHASFCVSLDKDSYFKICHGINAYITYKSPYQKIKDIHKNYLRFSEMSRRYLISGNLRAWIQTFENFKEMGLSFPTKICNFLYTFSKGTIDFISSGAFWEEDFAEIVDTSSLSEQERLLHEDLSVMFTVDRGVTHEMVRMREASFAQESTRYCNYSKGKFGSEITVTTPCFWDENHPAYAVWKEACEVAEKYYFKLLAIEGVKPQEARDVLPTSTKAEITITANLGEWLHILALRACDSTGPAHSQIKEVMVPLLKELQSQKKYSQIFNVLQLS